METKLEYMKRVLKEMREARLQFWNLATEALEEFELLDVHGNFQMDTDEAEGIFDKLETQVRIGEEYTKPYQSRRTKKVVNEITQLHDDNCVRGYWHEGPCA